MCIRKFKGCVQLLMELQLTVHHVTGCHKRRVINAVKPSPRLNQNTEHTPAHTGWPKLKYPSSKFAISWQQDKILQQTDNITSTALFNVENALFYIVNFSNVLLIFVDDFDNL